MTAKHEYRLIPESIADGYAIQCTCGWRSFETFMKISEPPKLFAELKDRFEAHALAEGGPTVEPAGWSAAAMSGLAEADFLKIVQWMRETLVPDIYRVYNGRVVTRDLQDGVEKYAQAQLDDMFPDHSKLVKVEMSWTGGTLHFNVYERPDVAAEYGNEWESDGA